METEIAMAAGKERDFLKQTRRYLEQQEGLFGPLLFREEGAPAVAPPRVQSAPQAGEPWMNAASVDELRTMIHECVKCPLGETRIKFVFGTGNPDADVMMIGEAPGADEDAQGEPFVGRAGQLLNKIIESVGMKREEIYICNIIKCRPPNNRVPLPGESETCTPYLMKQIELVKPKFIICLGRTAGQWLLKTDDSLGRLRGVFHDFHGIRMIVTYHPAALLRNPGWKRPTWEDMQMFKKAYDEMKAG
jgi:uracil-DNA glycosylase